MTLRADDPLGADHFPMLAQFLDGYLHQDFVLEHKTPSAALRAFLGDASTEERDAFGRDVTAFLSSASTRSWAEVVAAFGRLGGAWRPRNRAELAALVQLTREWLHAKP